MLRDGCYLGRSVTCMPPRYINAGAWVDDGTMVDSHALIGSCAQVVGVLEPVGALTVFIEDEVLLGGNRGVYEGTVVKRRAVLGTGVILNRSTPIYDMVTGEVYTANDDEPLVVPENAVVVAGARAVTRPGPGRDWGLSLYTPVIVKYRDSRTDSKLQLEDYLR